MNKGRNRLSSEYAKFAAAILGGMVVYFLCTVYVIYEKCQEKAKIEVENTSYEIQKIIGLVFREIESVMKHVGREIQKDSPIDVAKIARHLELIQDETGFICRWSVVAWMGPENCVLVTSRQGILEKSFPVFQRNYTVESSKTPWKLIACEPDWGFTTRRWVIPVGMGITNEAGQFLGTVIGGIDVHAINQKIRQTLNTTSSEFIVFDQEMNPVFYSLNKNQADLNLLARNLFREFNCFQQDKSFCQKPFIVSNLHFYNYEKLKDYSYYVFTGADKSLINSEFYSALFPAVLELAGLGLFFLFILYIFYRKLIRPVEGLAQVAYEVSTGNFEVTVPSYTSLELNQLAKSLQQVVFYIQERQKNVQQMESSHQQLMKSCTELNSKNQELLETRSKLERVINLFRNSDEEKEKFLRQINQELEYPLTEILQSAKILHQNHEEMFDFSLSQEQQCALIKKIIEGVQSLRMLTTDQLYLSEVDLPQVIQECITISAKIAFLKGIQISCQLPEECPKIFLDRLRFQQVVLGLISRALQYTPEDRTIELQVIKVHKDEKEFLHLYIRDRGFGLGESDLPRFKKESAKFFDLISLELSAIEKLVDLHSGSLQIESKWNSGTVVLVTLPWDLENSAKKVL